MENEENLNADNSNGEEETKVETAEVETKVNEEEPKFTDAERKAFARAKVAEAKVKELKAQLETKGDSKKSDVLDYGAKAYLAANGIKGAKEFEFVQGELKKSGGDLDSLLENGYFKTQLENFRALAQTADATPTGKRSSGVATDSVEYWVVKAGPNAEHLDEVPKEMRIKVVNALDSKAKSKGIFYNS